MSEVSVVTKDPSLMTEPARAKITGNLDFVGVNIFGSEFTNWLPKKEWQLRIEEYKKFYREKKGQNFMASISSILIAFDRQEREAGRGKWHVKPASLKGIHEKINAELLAERNLIIRPPEQILPIDDLSNEDRLEKKAESLAEKLLDDAQQVLENPDEVVNVTEGGVEIVDSVKRRKYVAQVIGIVSKMVQGKQGLKLKKSEDTRNNASFLMDMLKKAQAGTMTLNDLGSLTSRPEVSNTFQPNEQTTTDV